MLNDEQQREIILKSIYYIRRAEEIFNQRYPLIPIRFDLKGHTVGMYKKWQHKQEIRYNALFFEKYYDENLSTTVPHEVAHYVVDMQFSNNKVRPHGAEWKALMAEFGADASRTAKFDMSDIPKRRYSTISYQCSCRVHTLGIRRHNKVIQQKARYICRHCGESLSLV